MPNTLYSSSNLNSQTTLIPPTLYTNTNINTYLNSQTTLISTALYSSTNLNSNLPNYTTSLPTPRVQTTSLNNNLFSHITSIPNSNYESTNLNNNLFSHTSSIPNSKKTYINITSTLISYTTLIKSEIPSKESIINTTSIINSIKTNIISKTTSINNNQEISYKTSIPISNIKKSSIIEDNHSTIPIISPSSLINENNTNNSNLNPEEIQHSLFILQTQIINNCLKVFVISDFPIPKNFSLIVTLILYNTNNLRNLQKTEEIKLYPTGNYEGIEGDKIITFESDEEFNKKLESNQNKDLRIVITDLNIDNKETKESKEIYNFNYLNNNEDCLDTFKVQQNIEKGEVDFSNISPNYKITQYKINSCSQGCNFSLISNIEINEEDQEIELDFIKSGNKKSLKANCSLSKNNKNNITCSLNKEVKANYTLKDYINVTAQETITIVQENKLNNFELNCMNLVEEKKKSKLNIGTIIGIVVVVLFLVGAFVVAVIVLICNKKGVENNYKYKPKDKRVDFNNNPDTICSSTNKMN